MALDVDLASGAGIPTPAREPTLGRVLDALRGLGERRAVVVLLAAAITGTLVGGILTVAVSVFGGFVAVLGALVVALSLAAGTHAAGLLQMDAERGIGRRSMADALSQGLQALPLLILVGLAVLAAVVVVLVAVALMLALTKIPFLGPLLFVAVFPLSIVAVGLTIAGAGVSLAFAMGALWQGASPFRALAQTLAVLRRRAVPTLGRFIALGFVVAGATGVVGGVLSLGLAPVAALSASIVGPAGLGGLAGGVAGAMAGGGHMAAGAVGGLLLWAVALSLIAQVWLRGICGVYLDMSEGVDASASEALLRDRVEEARRRTSTATSTAPGAATSPFTPAPAVPPPAPPPSDAPMPAWEESTSPSMSASATMGAPADFERLQRAAFGETAPLPAPVPMRMPMPMPTAPRMQPPMQTAPPTFAGDDDATVPPSIIATARASMAAPQAGAPPSDSAGDIDLLLDDTPPAPIAPPAPPTAVRTCPACSAETASDDVFCNRCGHRLPATA